MALEELGHFSQTPTVHIQRTMMSLNQDHKTSFNVGEIIPFFVYTDVLPGETYKISLSQVVRLATPKTPTMDNLYLDIYFFADRIRNTWKHFPEFMGENNASAWYSSTEYNPPKWINSNSTDGYANLTYYDYMGLSLKQNKVIGQNYADEVLPNAFALRSLIRIYNYFFRDENLIAPITEDTSDNNVTLDTSNVATGGKLLKVAKFHDYFSSCLPSPQKGPAIKVPLGESAPVIGNGITIGLTDGTTNFGLQINPNAAVGLDVRSNKYTSHVGEGGSTSNGTGSTYGLTTDGRYSGMIADLTQAVGASVNALRLSVQTQKILETDARKGTRFEELISGHFNTTLLNQSRPEYLGGKRIPIQMNQIPNTTGTSDAPQGHLAAYSQTVDSDYMFTKSFAEWTTIIGIAVVRANHTYSQGISKMWTRNHRLEYYWPTLAHLGEGPVYNYEIYHQTPTGNTENNEVFGYQERWAEYRYLPDIVTAEMRPSFPTSLDFWHYGDDYSGLPVLSQEWLEEPTTYVNRTLAVQNHSQLIADFNTHIEKVTPIVAYSIPGLVDHF